VERRIESAFFEGEVAAASLVHFFHDLLAVHSFLVKKGKKQGVGIAFQHLLLAHLDTGPDSLSRMYGHSMNRVIFGEGLMTTVI